MDIGESATARLVISSATAAAEREAGQYHQRAILTGDPEPEERTTITLAAFYTETFVPKVLPLFRKNTRIRYEALWRQRVESAFGSMPIHEITEAHLRGFVRTIELEKRKPKGPSVS